MTLSQLLKLISVNVGLKKDSIFGNEKFTSQNNTFPRQHFLIINQQW